MKKLALIILGIVVVGILTFYAYAYLINGIFGWDCVVLTMNPAIVSCKYELAPHFINDLIGNSQPY